MIVLSTVATGFAVLFALQAVEEVRRISREISGVFSTTRSVFPHPEPSTAFRPHQEHRIVELP